MMFFQQRPFSDRRDKSNVSSGKFEDLFRERYERHHVRSEAGTGNFLKKSVADSAGGTVRWRQPERGAGLSLVRSTVQFRPVFGNQSGCFSDTRYTSQDLDGTHPLRPLHIIQYKRTI